LRAEHSSLAARRLSGEQVVAVPEIAGDTLELIVELRPADASCCGIVVRATPDGAEQTRICYDATLRQLIVDRSRSSQDQAVDATLHAAPLTLEPDEPLRLHLFVDRSVLEVFANERVSITSRIYPTRLDSRGVALIVESGEVELVALDAWRLRGIWEA
jgi:beta-fructofuranosidase